MKTGVSGDHVHSVVKGRCSVTRDQQLLPGFQSGPDIYAVLDSASLSFATIGGQEMESRVR